MVGSVSNNGSYYVRELHFDSDRMAGSVAHWKIGDSLASSSITDALPMADNDTNVSKITPPTASFGEFLDIINPLQHLPVIGNIYRQMTGDNISPVAQIIGGAIYGGGIGGILAIGNAAVQEHAGENNLGSAVISMAKSDHHKYEFVEDDRSAGMNRPPLSNSEVIARAPEAIEVASAVIAPPKFKSTDVFEQMKQQKREPVTQVSIDVAVAMIKKQQWNFNA